LTIPSYSIAPYSIFFIDTFFTFFLLSIPPPPRSPLFPYTTLFRSHQPLVGSRPVALEPRLHPAFDYLDGHRTSYHLSTPICQILDRKSTRLNSSHVKISYAVFCLKKKKKRNIANKATLLRSVLCHT